MFIQMVVIVDKIVNLTLCCHSLKQPRNLRLSDRGLLKWPSFVGWLMTCLVKDFCYFSYRVGCWLSHSNTAIYLINKYIIKWFGWLLTWFQFTLITGSHDATHGIIRAYSDWFWNHFRRSCSIPKVGSFDTAHGITRSYFYQFWNCFRRRCLILKSWSLDATHDIIGSYSERNWNHFRRSRPILYLGSIRVAFCWQWEKSWEVIKFHG